jgi:hypothetical protein
MTISKAQLAQAYKNGYEVGANQGKFAAKQELSEEMQEIRKSGIVELTRAAAELAQANAKLTYAMSQIANKLL